MSNVVISYSPNDFFYVKFDEQNNSSTIDNSLCNPLKHYDSWDTSCNTDNYDSIGTNGTNGTDNNKYTYS